MAVGSEFQAVGPDTEKLISLSHASIRSLYFIEFFLILVMYFYKFASFHI